MFVCKTDTIQIITLYVLSLRLKNSVEIKLLLETVSDVTVSMGRGVVPFHLALI